MDRFLTGVFFYCFFAAGLFDWFFALHAGGAEEKFCSNSCSLFCSNSCSVPLAAGAERIVCSNSCSLCVVLFDSSLHGLQKLLGSSTFQAIINGWRVLS